jgi:hypothetical protein
MNAAEPRAAAAPAEKRVVVMTKGVADLAPRPMPPTSRSAFVPLLLALLALLATFGWQTSVLLGDREALQAAHAGQQQTVDNAGKLRGSLDGLAADTQRLADGGNSSAALLVAELNKRGITINSGAAAAAAPKQPQR